MPIYLSRYIGSGTQTDPCRPVGSDQPGWSAIDLRADGGATRDGNGLNACLLSLPVHDPDPRLYQLASSKGEDLPLLVRAGLALRLNATIAYTRLDDLIAELLLRPPGNAWKPLRDRADRQLAIYLGGLLSPSPALRSLAAKIYSETWSTANSGSLTSELTWTEYTGTAWEISGHRARCAGDVFSNQAIADHDTDTDNQVATATLATLTYGTDYQYVQVTCRAAGGGAETHYSLAATRNNSPLRQWELQKSIAAAYTTLGTNTADPASGDIMEISAVDSSIEGRVVNAGIVLGPVTDTSITGNKRGGIGCYQQGAGAVAEFANFKVRDYATGTPFTVRQSTLRGGDVLRGVEPAGGGLSATVNQASETDLAQALTAAKRLAIGQATETDLAQPIAAKKALVLGQPTETDTAQVVSHLKVQVLVQTTETETAQPVTRRKARLIGPVAETDLAQPITRAGGQSIVVNQAVETDAAQAITVNPIRRLVNQVVETDAAQAMTHSKRTTLGQTSEADTAQPITARKLKLLGVPVSAELAQALDRAKRKTLGLTESIESALSIVWSPQRRLIGQATELDAALAIDSIKGVPVPWLVFDAATRQFVPVASSRAEVIGAHDRIYGGTAEDRATANLATARTFVLQAEE